MNIVFKMLKLALVVFLLIPIFANTPLRKFRKEPVHQYLYDTCKYYKLNYHVIKAVIQWESGWRPRKPEWQKGKIISMGLLQVSPETYIDYCRAHRMTVRRPLKALKNPFVNIDVGCW